MARRLHVTWSLSHYQENRIDGQRLRMDVDIVEDMTDKVFAYLAQTTNATTNTKHAQFDHVCSPSDLEDYPEDEPTPNHLPEWLRLSYVDLILRSRYEADQVREKILEDLRSLKHTLDTMDTISMDGDAWIDDEPADESDSSSSEVIP